MSPFLGVYYDENNNLIDMASGKIVTPDQIKSSMSPLNGDFLDSDGELHNISELGGGGGGITVDAEPTQNSVNPVSGGGVWSFVYSNEELTQTDYDTLVANGEMIPGKVYFIMEEG